MALKALAVILIIVAVAAVAIYLMGQFEPTRPTYDSIIGYVDQAKTWLTENWAVASASIGGIVTVGGAAYSKLSAAKTELTNLKDSATSQITTLTQEKDKLTAQLTSYEEQAKNTVSSYEQKNTDLKKQLEAKPNDSALQQELIQSQQFLTSAQMQKKQLEEELKNLQTRYDELRQLIQVK